MKLKNRQILALYQALHALDAPKGEGNEKPKPLPWKLRYAVARTISHLGDHAQAIEKARMSALEQFTGGKAGIEPSDPHFMEAQKAVVLVLDTENEVDVHTVQVKEIEDCDLSPAILSAILPIIEG